MKKTQEGAKLREVESIEEVFPKKENADTSHLTQAQIDHILKTHGKVPKADSPVVDTEKYFMVEWAISSNPMDPVRVKITVNGETLTWKRGVETAVPGRYLEAARHTTHEVFEQDPNDYDQKEGYRKTVKEITTYPYSVRREITKEEYLKLKAIGDKEVRDYLKNHGLVRA